MLDDIDKLLGDDEPTGGGGAGPDAPLVVVIDDDATVRRSLRFALDKIWSRRVLWWPRRNRYDD